MKFKYLNIFRLSDETLLYQELPNRLLTLGYRKLHEGDTYIYAPGDIPICLIAHVDTVFSRKLKAEPEIFFDKKKAVLWSPDGLGGDDRAGISAILEILARGYRPHVLFVDYEESGCIGAKDAIKAIKTPPDVKYVIELDRKGSNDACFYDLDNIKFERYVQGFGFEFADGIYTDICHICPAWGVAGVNLSIGYYNAHTEEEFLRLNQWVSTVDKVCTMLQNVPKKKFSYHAKPRATGYWYNGKFFPFEYDYRDYDYRDHRGSYSDYGDTGLSDHDRMRVLNAFGYDESGGDCRCASYSDYNKTRLLTDGRSVTVRGSIEGRGTPVHSQPQSQKEDTEYNLNVLVTAEDLFILHGGSAVEWNKWLKKKVDDIERATQDKVFEVIEQMIMDDYNNVYQNILTAEVKDA
jgi:hypothetical protein